MATPHQCTLLNRSGVLFRNIYRLLLSGCEKKRGAPYNLNMTLLRKQEPATRSKEAPFFGRVLSFHSRELFTKWIAALLVAEYQADIRPAHLVLI